MKSTPRKEVHLVINSKRYLLLLAERGFRRSCLNPKNIQRTNNQARSELPPPPCCRLVLSSVTGFDVANTIGLGVGEGEGSAVGTGVGVTIGVEVGLGSGVAVITDVGVGSGVGVADGAGVGVPLLLPPAIVNAGERPTSVFAL